MLPFSCYFFIDAAATTQKKSTPAFKFISKKLFYRFFLLRCTDRVTQFLGGNLYSLLNLKQLFRCNVCVSIKVKFVLKSAQD